tara:strand:+ start:4314 stop:5228 length:915 start_codon:yes stop_codon:yes gene_type:complete
MFKRLFTLASLGALFAISACDQDEAKKPTYLQIDAIHLETDFTEEGSAHQAITTVYVYANQEPVGAYEMPATIPVILNEGVNELILYAGINTNGIASFRSINDAFTPIYTDVVNPNSPGKLDTIVLTDEQLTVTYRDNFNLVVVEDFDDPGLNFESTLFSDTGIFKTDDPDSIFTFTPYGSTTPEPNSNSGLIILDDDNPFVELSSVVAYNLTRGAQNIYLEVSYKTNINVGFGLIADFPTGDAQDVTTVVYPKEEWSKIYINLITEFQAFPGASGYKVLITARKPSDVSEARIYLDNIKLIYE